MFVISLHKPGEISPRSTVAEQLNIMLGYISMEFSISKEK